MRKAHAVWGVAIVGVVASVGLFVTCCTGCGTKAVSTQYRPKERVAKFDNSEWARVLAAVTTNDGFVHHEKIAANQDGVKDALYRYVGQIAEVSPENRPELFSTAQDRLAYWINAYNAVCMYDVQERGRPANVRDAGAVPYTIFIDKFPFGGKIMSLDTVEKTYVRSAGDPRVHFALNCSSYSCPPLRDEPYEGAKIAAQMDDQGRKYLSDPRGAVRDGDNVKLGEIFRFYKDEFEAAYRKKSGNPDATLIQAIQQYAAPGSPVLNAKAYDFMKYDWSLNQAR